MGKILLTAATAAGTTLLATLPVTGASAATHHVLTNGRVGGPNVKVGATLKSHLKAHTRATFYSPGTKVGVSCRKATLKDKVRRNPSRPGTAVEALVRQRFSHCVTNIPGTSGVRSVKVLRLPYKTTVKSRHRAITVYKASTRLTLNTVLGPLTCTYSAARLHGTAVNRGSLNVFKNQKFTLSSGSAACPRRGSFSAVFGPITNVSVRGHPHVFVN